MAGGILISTRRDDAAHAGRLVERLAKTSTSDQLFIDVDSIEPGLNFKKVLSEKVQECDVLLASSGQAGCPRLKGRGTVASTIQRISYGSRLRLR